jgi:phage terminase large subunit-like protein
MAAGAVSRAQAPVLGVTVPRISTPAGGRKGRGQQATEFARDVLGVELMPWQVWLLDRACRRSGSRWTHRTVLTLVARQNGKTLVTSIRVLAGMVLWGERFTIGAAQSRDVAIESWRATLDLAEEAGLPVGKVMRTTGREEFQMDLPGGRARYKVVSSTSGGGRGLQSVDLVVLDELREHHDWSSYASLEKTRRAVPGSQLWAISTMGDSQSVVLDALQTQGLDRLLRMVACDGTGTRRPARLGGVEPCPGSHDRPGDDRS